MLTEHAPLVRLIRIVNKVKPVHRGKQSPLTNSTEIMPGKQNTLSLR
jgi:hypothetical protein